MFLDLLSPIKNHEGIDTPSKASRLWFLFAIIFSFIISLKISSGDFVMVSICTFIFSTILLNLGWILIINLTERRKPIYLSEKQIIEKEK